MADLEKKILEAPKLPNHIQGDGRYLMSLLKSFLEQTAEQVNLANGFSAEEINPEAGGYPTPRDFFLSFTRLGGEFTWTHLSDVSGLAYYELRTNQVVGDNDGLLERTLENYSTQMSVNYADTIYLYAVSKDGIYSSPAVINYSKPRPDAPQNIAITKSSEGTLISFSEIPSNCIGAHIYVNETRYDSTDNIFLLDTAYIEGIERIEVAFYDSFGDGERSSLSLMLPDVTGLLVERNGSQLDFYWDAVNIYDIKYVVKVSDELDWVKGIELFRTTTNDKNRYLYPNAGSYYIMVKAYDEYGNYSQNAAYQLMNNEPEIDKNIIFTSDQQSLLFGGVKINVFYDPVINGITLDREELHGEYLFDVELPQRYRARNWLESATSVFNADNDVMWEDGLFTWEEAEYSWGGIIGNSDGIVTKQQIAMYKGLQETDVFAVELYNNLLTVNGDEPIIAIGTDNYGIGRWNGGLEITDFTKLQYQVFNYSSEFSMQFNLRINKVLPTTVLAVFADFEIGIWLQIGYDQYENKFYIRASDGSEVTIEGFVDWRLNTVDRPMWRDSVYTWGSSLATWGSVHSKGAISDWLSFGISQSENKRSLYIYSYNKEVFLKGEIDALPIGTFKELYCYPKFV